MYKKILIIGANSDISVEFVKLLNKKKNFYFILSSKNINDLEKNYIFLNKKKLLQIDLTKPKYFHNFISRMDKDIDIVLSFAGYKEVFEINHLKIIKSNYLGLKFLINKFINKNLFHKLKIIGCVTSILSDKKNYKDTSYSLSKYLLSQYLISLTKLKFNNIIIKDFKIGIVNTKMNYNSKINKIISLNKKYVARKILSNLFNNKKIIYISYIWKKIIEIYNIVPSKFVTVIDRLYKKIST